MALNIKNAEVERLAAEVAELASESKTEAIRRALQERVERLKLVRTTPSAEERIRQLQERIRREFPNGVFGRHVTKAEREEILGYGPDGV